MTLLQLFFLIRVKLSNRGSSFLRKIFFKLQGLQIGNGTNLPKVKITWPHQVRIGNNCKLESNIFFKFDGILKQGPSIIIDHNVFIGTNTEFNIRKSIQIKSNCLIASGVKFIDHDHGFLKDNLINKQPGVELGITINEDVWIGANAVILKGVEIQKGAIIAAGSVVTKNIPSFEIWGGVPAKKISERK